MVSLRSLFPALVCLALAPLAHASTLPIDGTISVTNTSSPTDRLTVTTTYAGSTTSFSNNFALNQTYTFSPLFTLHINDTGSNSATSTASLVLGFSFNDPSVTSFTINGIVSQTTTYTSIIRTYSSIGTVTWTGGNSLTNALGTQELVTFADGAVLQINIFNGVFADLTGRGNSDGITVTEKLITAPTPEPGGLVLAATALAGLGLFFRRRTATI